MPNFTTPNSEPDVPLVETNQKELARKYGIARFEFPYPDSGMRHIGFAPKTQKWYGWSHRAIYGFGIGHVVKRSSTIANTVSEPFRSGDYEHFPVGFRARSLDDARRMAAAFARSVS